MKKFIVVQFVICLLFLSCSEYDSREDFSYILFRNPITKEVQSDKDYVVCITKDPEKDFKILNFADIQIDYDDVYKNDNKDKAFSTIDTLVSDIKPDLITLTGDHSYGRREYLSLICDEIDSKNIPWAPVFGNHDHEENNISIADQCTLFKSYSNCLFKTGPYFGETIRFLEKGDKAEKRGNYVVNIIEDDGVSFKVIKSLIFMDTGSFQDSSVYKYSGRKHYGNLGYDNFNEKQIKFYEDCVNSVQKYGKTNTVTSALFIHIPITAYVDAIVAAFNTDKDYFADIGKDNLKRAFINETYAVSFADSSNSKYWNESYKDSFGVYHEFSGCSDYDDLVFDHLKNGNTDLVLSGHDHIDNFVIKYQGITLAYAMKTGPGCYYDENMSGGTVITISSDGKVYVEQKIISK